jgi:hypothetical protein
MSKGDRNDKFMSPQEFQDFWKKREAAKGSKFGAIPTTNAQGEKFRSQLESTYYDRMKLLKQAGEVLDFQREVRFELIVNDIFICAYICDYIVTWKDGRVEHIDCKSAATMTQVYKLKKQLMLACHGITLVEVYK